jgi:outer membrane receptor protein involved in Fe transport
MFSRRATPEKKYPRPGFVVLAIVTMLLSLAAPSIFAQSDLASIRGTVQDNSGAAVPGASIEITSVDSGATRTTVSDDQGNFSVLSLERGAYKAKATATGFEQETVSFDLQVSQVKALDFALKVGAASISVEVTSAAPLVDTETSSMGEVVEGRQLSEIPLNGRNFTQLALLSPGVTKGAYNSVASGVNGNAETWRYSETGGGALSVNGLPPEANNYILDGVDNNESLANALTFFPPVEAMQEFRINTSDAAAEFGRAGGGVVQATIKSGTNQIHGTAFWFVRNGAVDADPNYFSPTSKILPFQKNQFGGTLGGPIVKDKLFIFGDYQATRQTQPDSPAFNTVPTAKMRTGDFSDLLGTGLTTLPNASYSGCNTVTLTNGTVIDPNLPASNPDHSLTTANGGSGAIFDPTTCAQWNYGGNPNVIDPARQNAAAIKYLNVFPSPNTGTAATIENNYVNTQNEIRKFNDFDGRIDWAASKKDTLFGRYSYGQDTFLKTVSVVGTPSGFAAGNNVNHPRGFAVGETHIFSPSVINEFRFGFTRPFYGYINPFEGVPFSQNLGILNANRNPLLGGGALIGGFNAEISYTGDGGPYEVPQNTYQYSEALSWSHKQHTFKFGANIMRREVNFFQGNDAKGFFSIGPGTGDFTGYEASELVAGFIDNYSVSNVNGYFHTHSWETGYFAQDDWKVNNRLILNLGLRYDLYTYPVENNNLQSNFDLTTGTLLRAGANGNSASLIDTNHNNFAPRFGFAYDLTGKHTDVVRGGYGIFYYQVRGGIGNVLSNNPEFNGTGSYSAFSGFRTTFTGEAPMNTNLNTAATAPLPLPTFASAAIEADPTNVNVISYAKHDPTSTIQEWNLQLEHQFGTNTVVDVAYVGAKADHETNTYSYSSPQLITGARFFGPQGLNVTVNTNNGEFSYHALQARLNRNMSHGLQTTIAYTWGHALDDATGAFSQTDASTILIDANGPLFSANYGNTDNDQRQAVTVSILYELPFGRGRQFANQIPKAADYLIGGWQLNPFWVAGTGTPYNITVNPVNSSGPTDRPDIIGDAHSGEMKRVVNSGQAFLQWFDQGAFAKPPVTTASALGPAGIYTRPGTLERNKFAGPGYDTLTASLFKNIPIAERVVAQLRFEGYNLLNHPQFANPDSGFTDGNFGLINSTRQHSERELQGAIRFTF